jgi:6-phosphogluconolactonase
MNRLLSPSLTLLSLVIGILIGAPAGSARAASKKEEALVYFGTYTGKKSKGIYVSRFDAATGRLGTPELAAESPSPSFLAAHPKGGFLYAVNEAGKSDGKPAGAVTAFAIDAATGKLSVLNQQSSGGPGPCHIITDAAGANVLVANYGGGSVEVLPVRPDGGLQPASTFIQHTGSGANPQRQEAPHAHGIYLDAANRLAYVPDLGLDKLIIYRFDRAKGSLVANEPPFASVAPGSGPRHFALHPRGRFAYVINEMACTVTAFTCDPKRGELKEIQTLSTLPDGEAMKPSYSTAELFVHPSGRFLYGSNRGHDTIVVYAIDARTGKLTRVENVSTQGKVPRGFGIDPGGKWLLAGNQNSDNVVVFGIDSKSGRLTPTGQSIEVGAPVSVIFVPVK